MKVLVACEESQAVTIELRRLGHEAYSCDIEPCSGGHPEWHIQGDALPLINGNCTFLTMDGVTHAITGTWDMLIAFPPCTYLSNAGNRWLRHNGILNQDRYEKGLAAKAFFLRFLNADCPKIAVENPMSAGVYDMPPPLSRDSAVYVRAPVHKENPPMASRTPDTYGYGYCAMGAHLDAVQQNGQRRICQAKRKRTVQNLPRHSPRHGRAVGWPGKIKSRPPERNSGRQHSVNLRAHYSPPERSLSMKKYRYMVTWGGRDHYVTCATPLEALKSAANEFNINWKTNAADMIVTPLREVKGRAVSW